MSFFIIFNKLLQNLHSQLPRNITGCLQVLDSSTECFLGPFQGNFELSLEQIFGHHLFLIQALQVNMKGIKYISVMSLLNKCASVTLSNLNMFVVLMGNYWRRCTGVGT